MKDHGRIRVLLVGGEADSREPATALREHLEGARVLSAPDPDAGFEVLESRRIDCLVSTYRLPEGDGLTFFGAVREEYPDLPFVLFAGADDADLARRALSAGVAGYVRRGAGEEQYVVLAHRIRTAIEASPSAGDRIEREEVSRELQEFRDRYRSLFENTNDAVAWTEYEGETPYIREANPAFRELFEPDDGNVLDRPLDDVVVDPANEERYEPAVEVSRRVRTGEHVSGELKRDTVDGPRTFIWEAIPHALPGTDEVKHTHAVYTDISARKRRERELERYETMVQASGDPVFTIDADGRFTFVNDALVALTGYEESTLLGSGLGTILTGDASGQGRTMSDSLLTPDTDRRTTELTVETSEGERVPCEIHVTPLPFDEEFRGSVGVVRDVSERREYEQSLQRERAKYRSLFEKSQDAIALVEFEGETPHIAEINEPFRTLFEPPGEGIVGKPLDDVVAAESQQEEAENVSQRVRQGTYLSGELERMTVDGPRDFLWQAVPLTDPATGDVTRAFAVYRDVSALRERERALERERDRLDEFASIVSHDLRNPLQVARGHLEIARDTGGEDHFDTIERSLRRMETLLEDLLVLAREDGTVDGTEPIDIAALVETCWREDIAGNGSLNLRTDRTVMAEQSRLRQLFSNLLGNAVEHGSTSPDSQARQDALEHGSPEQSVSRDCAAGPGVGEGKPAGSTDGVEITVGDLPGGFYVADDGPGIPAEEREQVFESGYSTSDDGTGFGLSIVAEIAEAHGWAVDVVDADGGGARFEITGVDVVERE
ncbi:hypothetical protein BRC87_01870 [Halobacteriales archaeon QS_4_66_20]|nr:MAG: hypothetical protein BRC87_01870 [Halobacteriales archaeon QS_4_66_20]